MKKVKLICAFFLFFLVGCSNSDVSREEALELANPIISSVLEYKKENNRYPKSLMDIKKLPYEIYSLASGYEYSFENRRDLMLKAGSFETGLNPETGFIYRIKLSFSKSRGSGAITSIFVGFREDDRYEVSYTGMPPAWKQ